MGSGGGKFSSGVQGQSPGEGLGAKPPEAQRMLHHEAEKTLTERNKNLAIANRSRVSCAHNSSRASP